MVVCILLGLFCRSGCQASVVASALAFHPPAPFYDLVEGDVDVNADKDDTGGDSKVVTTISAENTTTDVSSSAAQKKKEKLIHAKKMVLAWEPDFQPQMAFDEKNVIVYMLTTKKNTKVPLMHFLYPGAKYTLIYSHGNATDLGSMFTMYLLLRNTLQINVIAYDYTGYGASLDYGVPPTEKQTYVDIETVYEWCVQSHVVQNPGKEIILYGQSVGSGPSCYIASCPKKYPVAGIILHSPILSGLRVLTRSRLLGCFDIFPNINRIKETKCPVFIIHGKEDMEVGFEHGLELYEGVPERWRAGNWWVPLKGHNDVLQGNEVEFFQKMSSFISSL